MRAVGLDLPGLSRKTIERKSRKVHETRGRPLSLLIYTDGVLHPPKMPSAWAHTVLEGEGPRWHWWGIWVYDYAYDRIVASWHRELSKLPKTPQPTSGS